MISPISISVLAVASFSLLSEASIAMASDANDDRWQKQHLKQDFEFLHVPRAVRPNMMNYLPRSVTRVLGAALEISTRELQFKTVLADGTESSTTVVITKELMGALINGGFCSDRNRCRNVCCPMCSGSTATGVSRDPRVKILEEKFGSLESLFRQMSKTEERIRAKELEITTSKAELHDLYGTLGFDRHRERSARIRSLRSDIRKAEGAIGVLRRELKHAHSDQRSWRALLGGKEPPRPDLERELGILGLGAGILGQLLQFVPHPAARVLGIALGAGSTGLSAWLVMADGSERRVTMPLSDSQAASLRLNGHCNDGNRCGGTRCPICGWKR